MYQCINVSMYQCINVSMYQCINVSMYQCINVSMYQCINVSMYQCINVSVYQCINVSMYQCINVSMYQCINVSMYQCINVSMYQCINVSMYQCINVSMYQCINVSMYQCIKPSIHRTQAIISENLLQHYSRLHLVFASKIFSKPLWTTSFCMYTSILPWPCTPPSSIFENQHRQITYSFQSEFSYDSLDPTSVFSRPLDFAGSRDSIIRRDGQRTNLHTENNIVVCWVLGAFNPPPP